MGICCKLSLTLLIVIIAVVFKGFYDISKPKPLPKFDLNEYWGKGDRRNYKEDKNVYPSKIHYNNDVIEKLKKRLNDYTEITEPLENSAFTYGFNQNELLKIVKHWNNSYLEYFKINQLGMKRFPNFYTEIQGLKINFFHIKPKNLKNKKIIPIILIHGFPGSVREFYNLIDYLDNHEENFKFEIIVPCLPGFGWSEGTQKKGLGTFEMAVILRNLMIKLGHEKFLVHGLDWGGAIGSILAQLFPKNILGFHSSSCVSSSPISHLKGLIASMFPKLFVNEKYAKWFDSFNAQMNFMIKEGGFLHIQATKPDTIGAVLSNNPVGLAAYILEKFSTFTNPNNINLKDGGLTKYYKLNDLLDSVMIYYLTNSITTSVRLYAESMSTEQLQLNINSGKVFVPTACANFEHDVIHFVEWALKEKYPNLIQNTFYENGGHFAALENPLILYKDIISFVHKII